MGIIQKQAIKNTFYTYLGAVLGFLTSSFFFPHIFSTDENGLRIVITSIALLFAQFANLGFSNVTIRFFSHFRSKENKHHGFLFYPVIISVIGFSLWLILFLIFKSDIVSMNSEKSKLLADYILYLIPFVFSLVFFNVLDAYARAVYSSVVGIFLKELLQRVLIIISALLYFFSVINFKGMVIGYIISFAIPTIVLAMYLIRSGEWSLKPDTSKLSKSLASDMIRMGLFSILSGVASVTIAEIASIMVNQKLGLSAAGIYGILAGFGLIIALPARALYRISSTVIADAWQKNDVKSIKSIYSKSCITQLLIGSFLFLGLWCNIDSVLSLLPPQYAVGKYIIFFIGLGNLVEMATGVNGIIIANSKYYKYDAFFMVALIGITIITNIIFIPIYGIIGSAIASAVTITTFNVARYLFLFLKFGMQPYNMQSLKVLLVSITVFALSSLIPYFDNFFVNIFLHSAPIVIAFWILIVKMLVSEEIYSRLKVYLNLVGIKIP